MPQPPSLLEEAVQQGPRATSEQPTDKDRLYQHLRQNGRGAFAYATMQDGLEQFVSDEGYVGYITIKHPAFAPSGRRIALGDPICAPGDTRALVRKFLQKDRGAAFLPVSEQCANALREEGFSVNCMGYEPEIPLLTYNTKGDWKNLDVVKRGRNLVKREDIIIREEPDVSTVNQAQMKVVSDKWLGNKKLSDREIWIYARRPVFTKEQDVRKFVAYDKEGTVCGFAFYDPLFDKGTITGYSANTVRCDERRFGKLSVAVHMTAAEIFKAEGKTTLNLCIAPFDRVDDGTWNDDLVTRLFLKTCYNYGEYVYNFGGLSYYKAGFKAPSRKVYFATNRIIAVNDMYLAFYSSDIAKSYPGTLARLGAGMAMVPARATGRAMRRLAKKVSSGFSSASAKEPAPQKKS